MVINYRSFIINQINMNTNYFVVKMTQTNMLTFRWLLNEIESQDRCVLGSVSYNIEPLLFKILTSLFKTSINK